MRYTVITAFILFIIAVALFAYYIVYINGGNILNGNVNLNVLMISLVVISAILTVITYLLSKGPSSQATPQQYYMA